MVKMAAKYAKIDKIDISGADIQDVPLIQNFYSFHNIDMEKSKQYILINNFQNPVYCRNCLGQNHFWT